MRELIVDLFAGGGGASLGIELALGVSPDIAINHDPKAIAIHEANHPNTKHFITKITSVDPLEATGGRPVGLLWVSPDCKHFSKAKGGVPVEKNIRDLAWVAVHWADRARPRVVILENVEEFCTWGPLDPATSKPCKAQAGLTFRRFDRAFKRLGYRTAWTELVACDYGTPTTCKRLFYIARCDDRPIVWPQPTHGNGLKPYRTAAECIDWTVPSQSIFEREKAYVPRTLKRIARGVEKFVLSTSDPFIIPVTHQGDCRVYDVRDPLRTVTTANRGEFAFVAPWFVSRYGERPGQEPRVRSVERPAPTIVPTGNGANLVAAFMAQHNTGSIGHKVTKPVSTILSAGVHQQVVTSHLMIQRNNSYGQSVERPLRTVTAGSNHFAEVRTLLERHGNGGEPSLEFGGYRYDLVDIHMRMLTPRELFRAQGFPDSYKIDPVFNGKPLSKTAKYRACGNSVCPPLAREVILSNYQIREAENPAEVPLTGGLFG